MVSAIGEAIVGVSIYSIYMGIVNYLTDAYENYAALALSAAPLGRNTFVAFLPSASYSLLQTPEFGWAGSVLGFVGLASSTGPVVLLFKGSEIHAKSPFMLDSTLDEDEDEYKTSRAVLVAEERWDQRVLQEVRLEALMMLSEITDIHPDLLNPFNLLTTELLLDGVVRSSRIDDALDSELGSVCFVTSDPLRVDCPDVVLQDSRSAILWLIMTSFRHLFLVFLIITVSDSKYPRRRRGPLILLPPAIVSIEINILPFIGRKFDCLGSGLFLHERFTHDVPLEWRADARDAAQNDTMVVDMSGSIGVVRSLDVVDASAADFEICCDDASDDNEWEADEAYDEYDSGHDVWYIFAS
ncbi:hypothetical protein HBI81_208550 [Parastagonospora nodorum]|nr:hypothetical protein HBI79_152870 [Parastagonospora nodorum]KAH5750903.1 hypothetical protein HBI97_238030 [Parastagonospora nodorum]KAH5797442.1 hypothetical protein HBI94_235330 [Parastagonospora nodorum]KAH5808922.1 hypothetical protein HBI93_236350 [Parastagonospora nodorum]KAH5844577.1 hypothetical protein HBI91_242150 [Parastagonospora nodorum]